MSNTRSCILSKFYIKPQRLRVGPLRRISCILSKFYIKPQLVSSVVAALAVVSYRNSTSNHNSMARTALVGALYLIEILHQTTTCGKCEECLRRCILSKFYIKPQQRSPSVEISAVVSYRNSTSNHNLLREFVNC